MSNFEFLKQTEIFRSFADAAIEAENGIGLNTVTCSILSRRALELAIKWLKTGAMPTDTVKNLFSKAGIMEKFHNIKQSK